MILTDKNINDCIDKGNEILQYFQLPLPNIIEVKITNSISYWAEICRYKDEEGVYYYSLYISKAFNYIKNKQKALQYLQNTIMHEMVHTLPKCWNHKGKFIFWKHQILKYYPCIDISEDKKEFNYAFKNVKRPKYIIMCNKCKKEFYLYKKLKYNLDHYSCSYCKCENLKYKEEGD